MTKDELVDELAARFWQQERANALLENIKLPHMHRPGWISAGTFWDQVYVEIDGGALPGGGGLEVLVRAALRQYPSNRHFLEWMAELDGAVAEPIVRAPSAEPGGPTQTAAREAVRVPGAAEAPPTGVPGGPRRASRVVDYPTLMFTGSDRHDAFLRMVRAEVDPDADLLYASEGQTAVVIAPPPEVADLLARVRAAAARIDQGVHIGYHTYDFRPYLFNMLYVQGPDRQRFELEGVPATTTVRQVAEAVLPHYRDESVQDRSGRFRSTVVDHVGPDGQPHRLDPDMTLHEAGVQEGDQMHVLPRATAGAVPRGQWMRAVKRANTAMRQYSTDHGDFEIVETDVSDFPTYFVIKILAAGFEPPARMQDRPLVPRPRDEHLLYIYLHADFPRFAPVVVWITPVFHPNVVRVEGPRRQKGRVCLGALMDAYKQDLDFRYLCEQLVDMARYHNYEVDPVSADAEGFVDAEAAEWAGSDEGQRMIAERGGKRRLRQRPQDPLQPSVWPLHVIARDDWHHGA